MGWRSKAIVEREFSWHTIVEQHLDLYRELMGSH
jgi:hypothetical protein